MKKHKKNTKRHGAQIRHTLKMSNPINNILGYARKLKRKMLFGTAAFTLAIALSGCGGQSIPGEDSQPENQSASDSQTGSDKHVDVEGNTEQSVAGEAGLHTVKIEKTEVQSQDSRYVPIDEVGIYNREIITDEITDACTLGDITADALPQWKGLVLENKAFCWVPDDNRWEKYTPGSRYFTEDQIRFQAEQGFNCIRVLYSFSFLSNPKDIRSINMAQLEQLDELLAWCMKYNMHMMLSITGLPGKADSLGIAERDDEDTNRNDEIFFDEEQKGIFTDYWLMLARRYADIPTGALSFELVAEPSVEGDDGGPDMQRYFDTLAPIARGIWDATPGRVVIVCDVDKEVPEKLAEIGCCLSLHTHVYNHCQAEEEWYGLTDVEHHWPMENIPRYFHEPSDGKLALVSAKGFHEGIFKVCAVIYDGETPQILCDGASVSTEVSVNEQGTATITARIPGGTKEIALAPTGQSFNIELLLAELDETDCNKIQLNVPLIAYTEGEAFPTFMIGDDGSVSNLSGRVLDGDYIYEKFIKKFVDCAERNKVSFIETEIGTDTNVLDPEEYITYHRMWLTMLEEHGIGWMYNCERNIFAPKDLMWLNGENNPIPFSNFTQWEDSPYWINNDILELLGS